MASTSPAPSDNAMNPGDPPNGNWPLAMIGSRKFSELARTRTSTWPAAGCGTSSSTRERPSTPVNATWRYARIDDSFGLVAGIAAARLRGGAGDLAALRGQRKPGGAERTHALAVR